MRRYCLIYIVANCSSSSDSDVKTMPTNATTRSYVNGTSHKNSTSSNKSCNLYWLLCLLLLIPLAIASFVSYIWHQRRKRGAEIQHILLNQESTQSQENIYKV